MKKSIKLKAFCKANLSLNITGKDEVTGYHKLDSVMTSLDCYDTVTVTERDDKLVCVTVVGASVPDGDNTAIKAARAVMKKIGCNGFDICIEKHIPLGAGLGGSSADGAAVLRALDLFYGLTARGADVRKLALGVGSDVPFMLTGGLARVRGLGEDLFFIQNKLKLFVVGLFAGEVSTAKAYAEFDKLHPAIPQGKLGVVRRAAPCLLSDNDKLCEAALSGSSDALKHLGNALYEPAKILLPSVSDCVKKLADCGAAVNMTGSGGMVLGYFDDINKFYECTVKLKNERGFKVFAPAPVGVLHEWITR